MIRHFITGLCLMAATAVSAAAEPSVKVINFTADWCPNCQILNPRLDEAIEAFDAGSIERIDLDVTDMRGQQSLIERTAIQTDVIRLAGQHQASYLWDWYGGVTGIAVAISADNGEPLTCFMRPMTAKDIEKRLNQAKILAEKGRPGARKPDGPDCPAPMR